MTKTCIHAIITGVVQGVFFRASTKQKANSLSLTGWVRNLPSGQVECVICGDVENVSTMLHWLHKGPIMASVDHVEHVEHETISPERFDTFDIK